MRRETGAGPRGVAVDYARELADGIPRPRSSSAGLPKDVEIPPLSAVSKGSASGELGTYFEVTYFTAPESALGEFERPPWVERAAERRFEGALAEVTGGAVVSGRLDTELGGVSSVEAQSLLLSVPMESAVSPDATSLSSSVSAFARQ